MRFLVFRYTVFLSFLLVGFLPSSSYAAEPVTVYEVPPVRISEYIARKTGQKRILMIYASWCPTCRKKMPAIMNIERSQKGSIIAISVDSNFDDFSRYIANLGSDVPFDVLLRKGSNTQLVQGLAQYGMTPWTGVPHFYLLDRNNRIVKNGYLDIEYLRKYVGVR